MLEIVRPGDRGYESVRHVYRARGAPARVYLPRETDEVAEALTDALAHDGPLSVRSGGHGVSSIATNDGGSVVDLRRMDGVSRLDGDRVRVGAGARWGQVARVLTPWGLAISSGDSGDVGVGGLATTGGIGLMGRAHGLTLDRVVAVDLVTADGGVHHLDVDHEPELFWGVRGAGANLGIATSFELEAAAVGDVVRLEVAFEPSELASFLQVWGDTVESAPREVSAFLYAVGSPRAFAQATVVYAGDDAGRATSALQSFVALPGVVGQRAELVPYAAVPLTTGAAHTGQQTAVTHSGLADRLDPATTAAIAGLMTAGAADMVQVRSAGGAINDVAADATAYAHRHQQFSVTAVSGRGSLAFDAGWDRVRALLDGTYLSFESSQDVERVRDAFPPPTLDRLLRLKRRWDPDRVFVHNFDVSLADPAWSREDGTGAVS